MNKYGVAIKDCFGKWNSPLAPVGSKNDARDYAHFLLVKGWCNQHGEIKAVRVVEWTGYDSTRDAVRNL